MAIEEMYQYSFRSGKEIKSPLKFAKLDIISP